MPANPLGVQNIHNVTNKASDLLRERGENNRAIWLRAPKSGPEHYTGFSRSKLYELAGKGLIRSVSIRQHPGQVKGTRLFHLQSVLDYIASCEVAASAKGAGE